MEDTERLAAEAHRLLSEPLLASALDDLMVDAFTDFKDIEVTPDNLHRVIALQQRVLVLEGIRDRIEAKITASGQRDGGMAIEKKRPE